ncbi:MAG: hypothetical protein HY721_10460 [Planctomycetes bacterium]|nr:hypothetical protein [Planctomycetota bacterium]
MRKSKRGTREGETAHLVVDATHAEDHRGMWLKEYYAILNAHDPFRLELCRLFKKHKRATITRCPASPSEMALKEYLSRLADKAKAGARNPAEARATERHLVGTGRKGREPPTAMQQDFKEFTERWQLPASAWRANWVHAKCPDLYHSFMAWKQDASVTPRLEVGPSILEITVRPRTVVLPGKEFCFDPSLSSGASARRKLKEIVRHVERDGLTQIREIESEAKRHGWRSLGPAHKDPASRRDLLRRVFEKRILGHSWKEIWKGDEVRSAQKSAGSIERLLGLPPRKRGRPRAEKRTT